MNMRSTAVYLLLCILVQLAASQNVIYLPATIRDQSSMYYCRGSPNCGGSCGTANGGQGFEGTDFEKPAGTFWTSVSGLMGAECNVANGFNTQYCATLGADQTPVYAYSGKSPDGNINSPASFYTWYHDSPMTVNIPYQIPLTLVPGTNLYEYTNWQFNPINGMGWSDQCSNGLNYGFCAEIHTRFGYSGGEIFTFTGDDDLWIYIDSKLVIDLGSLHGAATKTINIDQMGLTKGQNYQFDMFYCERHSTGSDLQVETSLQFSCSNTDWCGICGGNGASCCTQALLNQYCNQSSPCNLASCVPTMSPAQGGCQYTAVNCGTSSNQCQNIYCDPTPVTGGCKTSNVTCDDGNACTQDSCDPAAGCQHVTISCDDGNSCTTDTCNTKTGCIHTNITCNDNNTCTTDMCVPNSGCSFQPVWTAACANVTCNDSNPCTIDTTTVGANGYKNCSHTPVVCSTDPCNPEVCSITNGSCIKVARSCDDGNYCTLDTLTCANGVPGCNHTYYPSVCNDDNNCTKDYCNSSASSNSAAQSCVYTPIPCPNTLCKISTGCNATAGGCIYEDVNCTKSVNVTNFCSVPSCDPFYGCVNVSRVCVPTDNHCYMGVCDPVNQVCTQVERPGWAQGLTTSGGIITCTIAYNTAARNAVISSAAIAGVAVGAAAGAALFAFMGKKGYDFYQTKNMKLGNSKSNPLYDEKPNTNFNRMYEEKA